MPIFVRIADQLVNLDQVERFDCCSGDYADFPRMIHFASGEKKGFRQEHAQEFDALAVVVEAEFSPKVRSKVLWGYDAEP